MRDPTSLPQGTITMLFSDIEGSTRMVHDLGDDWPRVLTDQREICRAAWAAHSGHEMGTEGDSFFVVFADARDAVAAAVAAQSSLATHRWPRDWAVRVRMGMHTGRPTRHEDGYVGLDLHRAARVAGVAHGGQVLLTEVTVATGVTAHDGVSVRDLGWHLLKDLPDRTHVFQLVAGGLDGEFPAIRSRGAATNFPPMLSSTVGRDGEIAELASLLGRDDTRLVTLTGPGGAGKTRLACTVAVEVAHGFADGVFFVSLTDASKADEVWPEIAGVLHLPPEDGTADLVDRVADLDALFVLDNLEQVSDVHVAVLRLLTGSTRLRLVATSRRPLHVEGEHEHEVPPLLLPEGTTYDAIKESGAVQMFVQHARRVRPGFDLTPENADDVATLCRHLDGLPLAIELVAARVRMLSPAALVARAGQVLDLSSVDHSKDRRQRTIRDTIAWSHGLLDPPQQRVLECLGVFAGGAGLEALGAVTSDEDLDGFDLLDLLFNLVDASLVRVEDDDDGEPRFSLLETVRTFARDQLDARGALDTRAAAHAQFFYDRTRELRGGTRSAAHARHRRLFVRELGNLRQMLFAGAPGVSHAEFYDGDVPESHVAALLAGALIGYSRIPDALEIAEHALRRPGLDPYGAAALHLRVGYLQVRLGHQRSAVRPGAGDHLQIGVELAHGLAPVNLPPWVDPIELEFFGVRDLMLRCEARGQLSESRAWFKRLLELAADGRPLHRCLAHEAAYHQAYDAGDFDQATHHLELELEVLIELGDEREQVLWVSNMADVEVHQGQHSRAGSRLAAAADDVVALGDLEVQMGHAETFAVAIGMENPMLSARTLGAIEGLRSTLGVPHPLALAYETDIAPVRALMSASVWEQTVESGRSLDVAGQLRAMAEFVRTRDAKGQTP